MPLNRERVTLNPYEESVNNIPLELGGDRWGHGIFIQPGGSQWPTAQITPQLAQSVDTEGALAAATTVGLKDITLKLQVLEPTDSAATNYVLSPQPGASGAGGYTQNAATGSSLIVPARDLVGFDNVWFQQCPGTNTGEGVRYTSSIGITSSSPYVAGVWLRGAAGGEAVSVRLGSTVSNVVLTTSWQWYTVADPSPGPSFQVLVTATNTVALNFYLAAMGTVDGSTFTEYFDGTFPGCAWSGVVNNSKSTRPASGGPRLNATMRELESAVEGISRYRTGTVRRTFPSQSGQNTRATYDLVGAQLTWDDTSKMNAGVVQGTLTLMAEPFGRGPEMTTTLDTYAVFIAANYTMDNGLASDFSPSSNTMTSGASNVSVEHRFIYTGGEYPLYSGEVSAQFTPGGTISGWKGGVIIERNGSTTYLEAYVTDNGTNSILNLDKVVAGTRQNLLTATLAARVASGVNYVIRIRTQRQNVNDNVYVEYFASTADPVAATTAPTNVLGPYVITDTPFGALQPNAGGIVITPQAQGAKFTALRISPYLARERSLPALRFGLCSVPGSAPALGRMTVQEDSGHDQLWMRWGTQRDRLSRLNASTDLIYAASSLTPLGSSSSVAGTGFSGAFNTNVISNTAVGQPNTNATAGAYTPILSTGAQQHIGDFEVWARVWVPITGITYELQWGLGDLASWTTNPAWTANNSWGNGIGSKTYWTLANLGTIHVPTVTNGTQQWQGNILASVQGIAAYVTAAIDEVYLVPLEGAGTARGTEAFGPQTPPLAYDNFFEGGANLNGATAAFGGAWATVGGSATDFTGPAGGGTVTRATTSDIAPGRMASIAGAVSDQAAQVNMQLSALSTNGLSMGLLLRFASTANTALVYLNPQTNATATIVIGYYIGGTGTTLAISSTFTYAVNTAYTLYARADSMGRIFAYWGTVGSTPSLVCSAWDAALAGGGTLASGKVGIWDFNNTTTTITRTYSQFSASTPGRDAAVFSGQQLEIRADRANRISAAGSVWAPPSSYTGQYLKIPVSTYVDGVENILVKAARNDMTYPGTPDVTPDALEVQVSVTPRYVNISNM